MKARLSIRATRKQRRLAFIVLKHPEWPAGRCLQEAGYKSTTATKQPGRAIEAAGTQQAITEELDRAGVTPELAAKRLREALDCQKVQRLVVSGGKGSPSKVESFTDIDNSGRLAAIETLAKLRGWVKADTQVVVQIVNVMESVGAKYVPAEKMGDYLRDVGNSLAEGRNGQAHHI